MPARRRLRFDDYKRIRELAALGVKHVDIARALGVHDNTWRRIRKRDVAAREAYKAGRRDFHASPRLYV